MAVGAKNRLRSLAGWRAPALSAAALALAGLGQASLADVHLPRWLAAPYCFVASLLLLILATSRRQRDTATGLRRWLWPVAGLAVALLCVALAVSQFRQRGGFATGLLLAGLSLAIAGAAFGAGTQLPQTREKGLGGESRPLQYLGRETKTRLGLAEVVLLILAVAAMLAAILLWWKHEDAPNLAFGFNAIAFLCVLWIALRLDRRSDRLVNRETGKLGNWETGAKKTSLPIYQSTSLPAYQYLALTIILLTALFLRTYRLLDMPYGVWYDEGEAGLEAVDIYEGAPFSPMGRYSPNNPSLFFYLTAAGFKLLGPDLYTLRLVTAAIGVATVGATYFLFQLILGRRAALIAAALLAASSWHVHFSRWAMQAVSITLWQAVAFYFLLQGLRTRRNRDFVLSAIALNLCLNTYVSARIVPVIIALYLLHRLVFQRGFLASHYRGLIAFGVVSILIFAPFGQYFLDQPDHFLRRSQEVSILRPVRHAQSWQPLVDSVTKTLLMFNYRGDANGRHNLPGAPMLNFFVAIPFVFGLGYSFYRWRRSRYFLLLAWLFLTLVTGFLSIEAPHAHRTLGAAPAAILLASFFLVRLGSVIASVAKQSPALNCRQWWRLLRRSAPRNDIEGLTPVLGKRVFNLALVALVLVVAYSGYDEYFNQMPADQNVWGAFSSDATVVAKHVSALSDDHFVYVSYPYSGSPAVMFMTYGLPPFQLFDLVSGIPSTKVRDGNVAYVLGSGYEELVPVLQHHYPEGQLRRSRDPFQRPLMISYTVSDVESGWGLMGRYYRGEAWSGEPALVRQDAVIDFDWGATGTPLPAPFSVEWQGTILAPQYGPHTFGIQSSSEAALYIDGCLVIESQGGYVENTLTLAKGLHAIRLRRLEESGQGQIALYWSPVGGQKEIVPPNVLGLFPTVNGLLANYYRNENWSGTPAYAQVVPFLAYNGWGESVPKPSAGEWLGRLHVPKSGSYRLGLEADDRAQLELDGQRLVDYYYDGRQGRQYLEHEIELSEGFHELRVRYLERRDLFVLRLWWTLPGGRAGTKEIVPMEALYPYAGPCPE